LLPSQQRALFDLDQPETRAAASADPGFFVSGPDPVLIDEFQHAPGNPGILGKLAAQADSGLMPLGN
jgi:hypothetical protein